MELLLLLLLLVVAVVVNGGGEQRGIGGDLESVNPGNWQANNGAEELLALQLWSRQCQGRGGGGGRRGRGGGGGRHDTETATTGTGAGFNGGHCCRSWEEGVFLMA